MGTKKLNAEGKGEWSYDDANDILLFKTKDRYYERSIEFGDIVLDIDRENFITGVQIFAGSKIFGMSREALRTIKQFSLTTKVESSQVVVQLRFTTTSLNKPSVTQGQEFVHSLGNLKLGNSEVVCTVA
ncbi:MAG TPA: DUF2283 domain-containing protein [Candidatus Nanoarchaeia archaeon]|nr:DUF2283 domain-containing protein [Candidatus Nanoarchaeia archaeon]